MKTERIELANIFKEDGKIIISYPNNRDVLTYEIYGFLKCYLKRLEEDLINSLEREK